MGAGRKTKLTRKLIRKMCAIVEGGSTHKMAYQAVGISASSFYLWLQLGREATERGEATIHAELSDALTRAEAAGCVEIMGDLRRASHGAVLEETTHYRTLEDGSQVIARQTVRRAPPNDRAARFILTNRRPEEFSERVRQEMSGPNGKPISLEISDTIRQIAEGGDDGLARVEDAVTLEMERRRSEEGG